MIKYHKNLEVLNEVKHIPYTYLLKFIHPDTHEVKLYYGLQYAKGANHYPTAHPKNFWVKYFTSSKPVKRLIKDYGKECFEFEIRYIFPNDPDSAADFEHRVLKRMKVVNNEMWLNNTDNKRCKHPGFVYRKETYEKAKETRRKNGTWYKSWNKGMTFEECYGPELAAEKRMELKIRGKKNKGKPKPQWFREMVSKAQKGRPKSEEHKAKLSKIFSGRKFSKIRCYYCNVELSENHLSKHTKICLENPLRVPVILKCEWCFENFEHYRHGVKYCCNIHQQRYQKLKVKLGTTPTVDDLIKDQSRFRD